MASQGLNLAELNLALMKDLIHTEAELEGDILILGAGGKMGPSLARLAHRAVAAAGIKKRVIAVARFTDPSLTSKLRTDGIGVISSDLLEPHALAELPDVENVIFMAA